MLSKKVLTYYFFLFGISSLVCFGQNDSKYYTNNNNNWLIEIPIWVPGFRGQLSYGDIYLDTEIPKDEKDLERIETNPGLEFYFVGRAAYRYKRFSLQVDAFSGKVGNTFTFNPTRGGNEKELVYMSAKGSIPRLILAYSVWKKNINKHSSIEILPYAGLRYMYIHFESDIFDGNQQIDLIAKWYEPLVGVSIPYNYKRIRLRVQADYGGASNKSSFMINSHAKYRLSRLMDVKLGWTSIYSNYTESIQNQPLDFSIALHGPTVGVGFNF